MTRPAFRRGSLLYFYYAILLLVMAHGVYAATDVLVVNSPLGSPVPPVGTNTYTYVGSESINCYIPDSPTNIGGVVFVGRYYDAYHTNRHICTGWIGSGSVPAQGSQTNMTVSLARNSLIRWQWQQQYLLVGRPHLNLLYLNKGWANPSVGWHDAGSKATLTPMPNQWFRLKEWIGDVPASNRMDNPLTVLMDQHRDITAVFTNDNVSTFQASSMYGTPSTGTNLFWTTNGVWVDSFIPDSPVMSGSNVRYVCTGWIGSGTIPATGSGTNTSDYILQDTTVEWQWKTQYLFTAVSTSSNSIVFPSTKWCDIGEQFFLYAIGGGGDMFSMWVGDVPAGTERLSPVQIVMDQPRSVIAMFGDTSSTLTVTSSYGNPAPGTGTNTYIYTGSQSIDCYVPDSPVTNGTNIRYVCDGWTGTGNVPASGSGTNVNITLNTDSAISWQWKTQYLFTAMSVSTNGSVSPTNGWYDSGGNVTVTPSPNGGYKFGWWIGDVPSGDIVDNPLNVLMDQSRTVEAVFVDVNNYVLMVDSLYGSPSPSIGASEKTNGVSVDCYVPDSPVMDGGNTRYVCTGWTGTGNVPVSGSGTNVSVTITSDSTISWQWKTQYLFTAMSTSPNGSVLPMAVWYDSGVVVPVTPSPNGGYKFGWWTGDVALGDVTNNPLNALMDQPRDIKGVFVGVSQRLLIVTSPYGGPIPPVGASGLPDGMSYDYHVPDSPIMDGVDTRYVCSGWIGTGSVPVSGSGTNVNVTITSDSTISWQWKTQYLFTAVSSSVDSIVNPTNVWSDSGSIVFVTAFAGGLDRFSGWTGDVPSGNELNNPLQLSMDLPRSVVGMFSKNVYVSPLGSDQTPYSSWKTAANDIQSAIDVAGAGRVVFVTNSTYSITSSIILTNGSVVRSVNGAELTIIDMDTTGVRCLHVGANSALDGFTVMDADIIGTAGMPTEHCGGGIWLENGGAISNCIVTLCSANKGGGIYCENGGIIANCIIENNNASTLNVTGEGGGVYIESGGTIRTCLIIDNVADTGGGVKCNGSADILSSTICDNTATIMGGGLYLNDGGQVWNSIVYYNTDSFNYPNRRSTGFGYKYYYSCSTPSFPVSEGGSSNFTNYPSFVDRANGDYRLLPLLPQIDISACVESGYNAVWMAAEKDLAGNRRIYNANVDRGAYEYVPPMISSSSDGNGTISPTGLYYPIVTNNGIEIVSVPYSNDITYVITPDIFYKVSDVFVNGQSVGALDSFTFYGVVGSHDIYAEFVISRPTLTVNSIYGTTLPAIGTYTYNAGQHLFCIISDTEGVTNGTTRYMFDGWRGTGSVPPQGAGNLVDFTIWDDSVLTWQWKTQYLFTAASSSTNCSVSPSNEWVDAGTSDYMVTATPGVGYDFVRWAGDVAGSNILFNPLRTVMDQARSVTGIFEVAQIDFVVTSDYGVPNPPVGTNVISSGSLVSAFVPDSPLAAGDGTQQVCIGWTGTGDVPISGSTTNMSFIMTTYSALAWNWEAQFRLITEYDALGGIFVWPFYPATNAAWITEGTVVEVEAYPDWGNRYRFEEWIGDVPAGQEFDNPIDLLMNRERSIRATFAFMPTDVYVSPSGSHTPPFTTWLTAATNLGSAVDLSGMGTVIHVANGTYTLTSSLNMDAEMTMVSENGSASTIIDGANLYGCVVMSDSSAVIDGFTIMNGLTDKGGGVYIINGGEVRNCVITGNTATNRGGGVCMDFGGVLTHSIVSGNQASFFGAGVAVKNDGLIRNCLIYRNGTLTAPNSGGGIYCDTGGTIESCTIATNLADQIGGGVYFDAGGTMSNSIAYHNATDGNVSEYNYSTNGSIVIAYSCSFPQPDGAGNEDVYPKFMDIDLDNYALLQGSPCVDAGYTQAWMVAGADLPGSARIQGGSVDMGAYEGFTLVYGITATRTTGGTINPQGTVYVLPGGNATFTMTPTGTYYIAEVTVDSSPIGATNSYTFSNVGANRTIHVTFASGAQTAPLGTPYWWLDLHGLMNYAADELTDNDTDGHDAWEEYIADTIPTDGNSYLHIADVTAAGASHVVTWASSAVRVYSVMTLLDLISGTWTYVPGQTNLPGTAGAMSYTNSTPASMQFYRISVSLP